MCMGERSFIHFLEGVCVCVAVFVMVGGGGGGKSSFLKMFYLVIPYEVLQYFNQLLLNLCCNAVDLYTDSLR